MSVLSDTRVENAMVTGIVTVIETDKMEKVSGIFQHHDINAAPVVDQDGRCVGIISSHDIVEYEARRKEMSRMLADKPRLGLGVCWDVGMYRLPGFLFDEVGFHMSKLHEQIKADDCLDQVARRMCRKHIHHVVVLDVHQKPIGLLSTLDLLGLLIDETVCRKAKCGEPEGVEP